MTEHLQAWRRGRLGRIRLNRPGALNALTLDMLHAFDRALNDFIADPEIVAVHVDGAGERAFCAGGDIRLLYDKRDSAPDFYKQFWRVEYPLNARIAALPKPCLVLMDGLVMGGGVGLSAHASHRLVTPRTRFAMPETQIGFLPDTGGSWLLGRRGAAGAYLALTGATIGAGDVLRLALADYCVDPERLAELEHKLSQATGPEEIGSILDMARTPPPPPKVTVHENLLARAFGRVSVDETIGVLEEQEDGFAKETLEHLLRASPTSLKLTRRLLTLAASGTNLETALINEYRAACGLLNSHDLYEGIRAAIIDRDKNPRWSPDVLSAVEDSAIDALLRGTGDPDPEFRCENTGHGHSQSVRLRPS